jgi:hypothetical protein
VKISEAKQFIKNIAEKKVRVTPLLIGTMGVGKSQIVLQVAQELGIGFIDLRLAQLEPGDLIGIPYSEEGRTHWAVPEWWPAPGTRGILLLDEVNRAPNDVRQAAFQLVLDGKLHTHVLPEGWIIVAAANPDNSNYQVETLDIAFLRRFCAIVVQPDVEEWTHWAAGPGKISPDIIGFALAHKQLMYFHEDISLETKPSFDGATLLNRLRGSGTIPPSCEFEVASGLMGKDWAASFSKWMDQNYMQPVSGEEVLNKYDKIKEKLLKQRNDEMWVTCKALLALLGNISKPTKKQSDNLIQFILDVAAETKATLVKNLPHNWLTIVVLDERVTEVITKILEDARKTK